MQYRWKRDVTETGDRGPVLGQNVARRMRKEDAQEAVHGTSLSDTTEYSNRYPCILHLFRI